MTACARIRLSGSFDVGLPSAQAFTLFTPTGERAWAHGWDPEFPCPAADDTEPGVVFRTRHGDRLTTWTVIGSQYPDTIQYAQYVQAAPGDRAGIVRVRCQPAVAGTRVTVGYDLTAVAPEANAELDRFAAGYREFLASWERAIADAIAR